MTGVDYVMTLLSKFFFGLIIFLIAFRGTQFLLTWALVILEDFCHMFVPPHKHYTLWLFKKFDNIINKFRWDD